MGFVRKVAFVAPLVPKIECERLFAASDRISCASSGIVDTRVDVENDCAGIDRLVRLGKVSVVYFDFPCCTIEYIGPARFTASVCWGQHFDSAPTVAGLLGRAIFYDVYLVLIDSARGCFLIILSFAKGEPHVEVVEV